jgi:hypothetical protein
MKKKFIGILVALTLVAGIAFTVPAANQGNGGSIGTLELPSVY